MPTKKEILNQILAKVDELYTLNATILNRVQTGGQVVMATVADVKAKLDELEAKVATDTQVKASAATLMDGLSDILRQIKTDPAAIDALANQLDQVETAVDSSNAALADAVQRNTPAVTPA